MDSHIISKEDELGRGGAKREEKKVMPMRTAKRTA